MRSVPKWNTLAARTASAPASTAGAKCASVPAPPLAITGTVATARTARISSKSKPMVVPGLPLSPLPQAEPPKWAGNTSMWSGSLSSLPWMLS